MTTRKFRDIERVADQLEANGGGWVIYDTVSDRLEFSDFDCSYDLRPDEIIFEYWLNDWDDAWALEEAIIPDIIGERLGYCFY